ncbi:hypothetical protein O1Q96_20340 [Streptomyces sp. Qhu-G9]|uniref:hypothetical protein n=1 Tax=Streptomyces sp. Qhu-G9 TaxID=3452799 RepID=UPI0022AC2FFD|nr:hypothetical protein [Streptomyces aurantiacus]WAU81928.1 hypothetical protein O1Q96_20340 [Streptomyces aurantiacus]
MPSTDDEREVLTSGVHLAVFSTVLLVVIGLVWDFPWQALVLFVVASVAVSGLITVMTLADVQRAAQRRAMTQGALVTWAGRNGGSFVTTSAALTGDVQRWELPASPRFRGELLAVGRCQGIEVGVACSIEDVGEVGTSITAVLLRLSEQRPTAQLRRRDIRRLDLPQGVDSVETDGHELRVRFEGWPPSPTAVDTLVDAVVRLAARPLDT